MAITNLDGQVIKEMETVEVSSGIGQAQAYEGLLAKLAGSGTTNHAQASAELAGAGGDTILGVIQNVSGATLTSSPGPGQDSDGTTPGGTPTTANVARRGNVICRFDPASAKRPVVNGIVIPDAAGKVANAASLGSNTLVGHCIYAGGVIPGESDYWGIVRLAL